MSLSIRMSHPLTTPPPHTLLHRYHRAIFILSYHDIEAFHAIMSCMNECNAKALNMLEQPRLALNSVKLTSNQCDEKSTLVSKHMR